MKSYDKLITKIRLYLCEKRKKGKYGSSLSDNLSYPEFCKIASENDEVFRTFKENSVYLNVLEHTTYEFGLDYMKFINERSNLLKDNIDVFKDNELYGGGKKYYYEELGVSLSPSTLRYAKVLEEINELFDISGMGAIAEIGVGYGGQCRLIKCLYPDVKYNCIDLPQVCMLAAKWLGKYDMKGVSFIDGTSDFQPIESDLVISNYAYSELRRDVQDMYFSKVIRNSKHGYITWNRLSERMLDGYTLEEFATKIENCRIIDEIPLTYEGNAIIIW